jgi:hypothetical protein
MRAYIANITNGPRSRTYDFATPIGAGMFWETRVRVGLICDLIASEGINVRHPYGGGDWPCSDFQVEPHPRGGFAISCEMPAFVS